MFALKKLKQHRGLSVPWEEFDLEVQSLIFAESRAKQVPEKEDQETRTHLIQLLATFEVFNSTTDLPTYYMLFPWADGDLGDFWKQEDGKYQPRDKVHIAWMIDQFYHLAKALQCVHNDRQFILSGRTDSNRFGRHGDIKPRNFLFFRDHSGAQGPGLGLKIKMADFGLGRLYSKESRSKQTPGSVKRTESYAAPEYELPNGLISPKSDIFSLGCVFLEYIVWLFTRFSGLESFNTVRVAELEPPTSPYANWEMDRFWKCKDRETGVLKDCVKNKIKEIKDRDDCVEAVGDLLEVIELHMLNIDREQRCDSLNLVHKLDGIRRRWKRQDSLYGTRPWKESMFGLSPSF